VRLPSQSQSTAHLPGPWGFQASFQWRLALLQSTFARASPWQAPDAHDRIPSQSQSVAHLPAPPEFFDSS
jgi:hypothetical protein